MESSMCAMCGRLIVQVDDAAWAHVGEPQPRHIAWPMGEPPPPPAQESQEPRAGFLGDVAVELERAERLHAPLNSAHEAYAVIKEELDEFWDEVRKKQAERDPEAMYRELVQIAAMCARTARNLRLDL